LLGREYFELAAMRHHPLDKAKQLRRSHQNTVFLAGSLIAAFVLIPIVNLATPLFGMALMVHVHHHIRTTHRRIDQQR
jgi:CysZ protein